MSSDHDGMGQEFCLALEYVRAKCTGLARAESAWVAQRLRHHLFGHAYRAYDRGDYPLARQTVRQMIRQVRLRRPGARSTGCCAPCPSDFRAAYDGSNGFGPEAPHT